MDTTTSAAHGRSASGAPAPRGIGAYAKTLARVLSVLALCAFAGLASSRAAEQDQAAGVEPLRRCPPAVSADDRLLTERWTAGEPEACDTPVQTRVTDRFLGFTCTQGQADAVACHAFLPPPGSRAFDTSRHFRCVDFAVTDTELGTVFTRMREWIEPTKTCDWSRSGELPAMEVDFGGGRACVMPGGLCISVGMLTPIGKVRLRQSIEKALREFGLARSGRLDAEASALPAASPHPEPVERPRR
jgi:hypothetical protein